MKDIVFWVLLIIIFISILYASQYTEGFQSTGDINGWAPPSTTLLAAAPGGIASVNALPRIDPSMEKSPYVRIKEVLESAKAFIDNEAPNMTEMSDPSVQLPLTTLKADIQRLDSEVLVLQRNPGIESTLTQHDIDGMEANLTYLQKKWRESVNSMSGIEGFEGFQDASDNTASRASLIELNDLIVRITVEITRLSASGTTDPIIQARMKTLNEIKSGVQTIIDKVTSKLLAESDIPILTSDYKAFLPILGTSGNLPKLLANHNLPPSLSSLFPASLGDISGASIARYLFDNYSKTLFNGLSFEYTSQRALDIANAKRDFAIAAKEALATAGDANAAGAAGAAGAEGAAGVTAAYDPTSSAYSSSYATAPVQDYRGEFAAITGGTGTEATAATAAPPARFDWKERSRAICEAVQKRGYNPGDFGCVADMNAVGANFSWRGYAKMVCSRIATIYDTGAPEACGCPPPTWNGWRL